MSTLVGMTSLMRRGLKPWVPGVLFYTSKREVISSYAYTYDNVGNRLTMTEADGSVTSYGYDRLYRLTNALYPDGRNVSYTYDPVGNRLTLSDDGAVTNYSYDNANRLLAAGSISYTYDNNGNTISKANATGTTIYSYDYANRLVGVAYPDNSASSFSYNPLGKRVVKTDSNGLTYFLHDGYNVLIEMNSVGATTTQYTTGLGIDEPISRKSATATSYYHRDGLGSVTGLTDATQNVVATYKYDAFGSVTAQTGTAANPYKFTSREFDDDSVLYFYRARYYDCRIGRFVSEDPIGLKGGVNRYTYVSNNPINSVDPLGLLKFYWYGYWGGPGWVNRQWKPESQITPADLKGNVYDARDQCYKDHDICMWRCDKNAGNYCPGASGDCKADCDHKLGKCEWKLGFRPARWIEGALFYSVIAEGHRGKGDWVLLRFKF